MTSLKRPTAETYPLGTGSEGIFVLKDGLKSKWRLPIESRIPNPDKFEASLSEGWDDWPAHPKVGVENAEMHRRSSACCEVADLINVVVPGVHGGLAPRVFMPVADIAGIVSSHSAYKHQSCGHPEGAVPAITFLSESTSVR